MSANEPKVPLQHYCPGCKTWYDCELGDDCTLPINELICADCDPEHHAKEAPNGE